MRKGSILVLSGPSGAGKGTVIRGVLHKLEGLCFSVSATTRERRGYETEGVEYRFMSLERFTRMVNAGEFVEYAQVHGDLYGTPLENIEKPVAQGCDVLLDIDVQGAAKVLERYPEAVSIFLIPPSLQELERRLRKRGTETEEKIARRLQNARREVRVAGDYDFLVVNDELDAAVEELAGIISAARSRTALKGEQLAEILRTFQ